MEFYVLELHQAFEEMEAKRIKEANDSKLLIEKLKNDNAKMKEMVRNQETYQSQIS